MEYLHPVGVVVRKDPPYALQHAIHVWTHSAFYVDQLEATSENLA
jgi:hypothetical protein